MTQKLQKYSIHFFILTLFLTSLACQAPNQFVQEPDQEALIAAAVATVQAGEAAPSQIEVPAITQSSLLDEDANLESILINIYRQINPAVVHIFVRDFGVTLGSGSGFVYDTAGHIVTNNHVVADGTDLEVSFADGTRVPAQIIGTDVDSDLAVIKVDQLPPGVAPIPLGDSRNVQPGQFAVAIGNPFGEVGSMSVGIISGLGRTLESQRLPEEGNGRYNLPQVLQTDAAINPGNSGGPLLNLNGEVIGVNSAILTRTGTNSGVGFSIPVAAVKRIIPTLISDGEYVYPYIGISMASSLSLEALTELGLPPQGVYITRVVPNSPADQAGLLGAEGPGGDYIIAVDGQPVKDSSELISYLVFQTEVLQTIELTIIRDNEEVAVPLTLGVRP